jgi:hypothetical protein
MTQTYCIYTDKEIPIEKTNREHIIPLSLGGSNEFVLNVDKVANSELGAKIDGKLANDFLIQLLRKTYDTRGHSNQKVTAKWKNSRLIPLDIPIQVSFIDDELKVYDVIAGQFLDKEQYRQMQFESKFQFDRFIRIKFTAKTLLAAGYYVYGDLFRSKADHSALRDYMNNVINKEKKDLINPRLRLYDRLSPIEERDEPSTEMLKLICSYVKSSCVIFVPLGSENIGGAVGILGELIGTINFKANTNDFPNDGDFTLGHIVYFKDKRMIRKSFYDMLKEIADYSSIEKLKT